MAADAEAARRRVAELSSAAWGLSSLAAAVEAGLTQLLAEPRTIGELAAASGIEPALVARLLDVLAALGLVERDGEERFVAEPGLAAVPAELLRADLRTTLLQTHDLFDRARHGELEAGWRHTDEDILQAQGLMSAGAAEFLERALFPSVPGIPDRLAADGAAFLDVGAGVGAVSIELCRRLPKLRAVGLEPQDAPLALPRGNVRAAGLEERVELRRQLVQELDDEQAFDVAWLPGNFMPTAVLAVALERVLQALRPGGLILVATLGGGGTDLPSAAARLRATLWGGDSLEPGRLAALLDDAGYADIRVLDRMPNGLVPMHARRPG